MKDNVTKQVSNREVKASAFTAYFSDPKNDMAFTVRNKVLVISEHQSTINLNMPLRSVIYYGRTMEKLIEPKVLYRKGAILIPTPEFYVFYNGDEPYPSESLLKLSDVYLEKTTIPMLELSVRVININLPEGNAILEHCRPLYEYSWFIPRIKDYLRMGILRDEAITRAIGDCEKQGIMADFVREYGSEALNMLFTQFNMEDALEVRYEEGFEAGEEKGRTEGELSKLIGQVCRKLEKEKLPQIIAEELEEDEEVIDKICMAVKKCGNYDVETILKIIQA